MKLNPKIFKNLTGEPFDTQEIEGKKVEFYYMDDTPYLFQYASRGRFAVWTSDGVSYKVLIEKTYYEALSAFYQYDVNKIWLGFLDNVSGISKKVNMWFMIPTFGVYAIAAVVALTFFQAYTMQILLGMIVAVVISNIFQGRIVNNKVRAENMATQNKIRDFLGNDQFDDLVKAQEEHYQAYFKFNEEPKAEETQDQIEPQEEVVVEEAKDSDDQDGSKGN